MAGGALKGIGGVLLTLGIVLLLVGGGAAGYGLYDLQKSKEEGGPFGIAQDPQRRQRDEQMAAAGGVGAAAGLVLLVLGIALLASGAGRANRALVQATAGAGKGTQDAAAAAAGAAPAAKGKRTGLVAGAALAALLVLVAVLFVAFSRDGAGGSLLGSGQPDPERGEASFGQASLEGRVASGPTVAGVSQPAGDGQAAGPFSVPSSAHRVQAHVDWKPAEPCCATVAFDLEQDQNGKWVRVGTATAAPGAWLNFTFDPALGLSLRFTAWPGEDGVSAGQAVAIEASWWR